MRKRQHTVRRLRSEVDLDVGVEVDVVERLHLDVGDGRLREPGHEAGDDEHGGDLGRVAEAVVGHAGVGASVLAPRGGDPQGTLSVENGKLILMIGCVISAFFISRLSGTPQKLL